MLTRQGLMKTKAKALRQRTWFQTLSRVERGILDLTIRCVETVRSRVLARIVSDIIAKIVKTLKPSFLETAMRVGREIAHGISAIALKWGNMSASRWQRDLDFIRLAGVNAINITCLHMS